MGTEVVRRRKGCLLAISLFTISHETSSDAFRRRKRDIYLPTMRPSRFRLKYFLCPWIFKNGTLVADLKNSYSEPFGAFVRAFKSRIPFYNFISFHSMYFARCLPYVVLLTIGADLFTSKFSANTYNSAIHAITYSVSSCKFRLRETTREEISLLLCCINECTRLSYSRFSYLLRITAAFVRCRSIHSSQYYFRIISKILWNSLSKMKGRGMSKGKYNRW